MNDRDFGERKQTGRLKYAGDNGRGEGYTFFLEDGEIIRAGQLYCLDAANRESVPLCRAAVTNVRNVTESWPQTRAIV
jgi:hypothetical protein